MDIYPPNTSLLPTSDPTTTNSLGQGSSLERGGQVADGATPAGQRQRDLPAPPLLASSGLLQPPLHATRHTSHAALHTLHDIVNSRRDELAYRPAQSRAAEISSEAVGGGAYPSRSSRHGVFYLLSFRRRRATWFPEAYNPPSHPSHPRLLSRSA
ncbi:unnamed protein product [Diplocarpon coronariae]